MTNEQNLKILSWIKDNPLSTSQQIGDALYDQLCPFAPLCEHRENPPYTRRHWALVKLKELTEAGKVRRSTRGPEGQIDMHANWYVAIPEKVTVE